MGWAWCSGPPHIGVTAPSSCYKSEPIGLRGQTPPVFRTGNISRLHPQTPSSYQFWGKSVCLLHVGWGPDLGYSVVLVLIVFMPVGTSILRPGENFIKLYRNYNNCVQIITNKGLSSSEGTSTIQIHLHFKFKFQF